MVPSHVNINTHPNNSSGTCILRRRKF